MANNRFTGNAPTIAQVSTVTVTADDAATTYKITINSKVVSVAGSGSGVNTTAANLQAALAASTYPEFQEVTWTVATATITGTAVTAGVPFTATSSASGGTGTIGAVATPTANSGPSDIKVASNWSTGALPVSTDSIYFQNSNVPALYNLDALAAITPALVQIDASYTGSIGLPYTSANGYTEYRQKFLQLTGSTLTNIGLGQGAGSGKIQIDYQGTDHVTNIYQTAQSTERGMPAVQIKGGNSASKVNLIKGTLGLALSAGETATLPTLNMSYAGNIAGDAQVWTGTGCTLTTVSKTGGSLYSLCAVTTLTSYAGSTTVLAGNMTTASLLDGGSGKNSLKYQPPAGGTITTNTVENNCTLDCSGTLSTVTLTNSTWYKGATINAPGANVTMSNHASIPDGQASDVTVNLGVGKHILID